MTSQTLRCAGERSGTKFEEKQLQPEDYVAFSPTNKGARLINGSTIHSMYHKFKRSKKMLFNILENKKYIVIDEVSMMIEKFILYL